MQENKQKQSVFTLVNVAILLSLLFLFGWLLLSRTNKTPVSNNTAVNPEQNIDEEKLSDLLQALAVTDIPTFSDKFLEVDDQISGLQSDISQLQSQSQQGAAGSTGATGPAGPKGSTGPQGADGDAFFTQVGSDIYYSGGNFGLGTASPQEPLHVIGNARISSLISCDTIDSDANGVLVCGVDATGAGGSLTGSGTNGQVGYFNGGTSLTSSANLLFDGNDLNVASGTLFVDQSTGRVGIGTITPGVTLDVNGTFAARSTTNAIFGNGSIGGIQLGDGTVTKVPGKYFVWNTGIRLNSTVGKSIVFGPDTLDGTDYTIKSDSHLALYSNSLERLRIDTSGNLGIGTTSPASLLSVGASNQFQVSNAGLVTYVAGTTDTATSVCRNAAGQLAGCSTTGTGAAFVQGGNSFGTTATLGTNDNQALNFITNGTTRCSIAATGGLSCPGAGTDSEVFGRAAGSASGDSIALGVGANISDINQVGAIVIGRGASNTATVNGASIAIGRNASVTSNHSVALGTTASAISSNTVAIGSGTIASSDHATALGRSANSSHVGSIAIGSGATTTANYQFVIGGGASNNQRIENAYFGKGVTHAAPLDFTLNATGGSGTDIAGANLALASGRATGSALGGDILFQTSDAGASGTTLRSLSTKLIVKASGNVGIGTTNPSDLFTVGSTNLLTVDNNGRLYNGALAGAYGSIDAGIATTPRTAGASGVVVRGLASQAGDLLLIQNSTGTTLSKFNASGFLSVGTATTPTGGVATFNGNVGIGTTSPTVALDIRTNSPRILLSKDNGGVDNKAFHISSAIEGKLRFQALNDAGSGGTQIVDFVRTGNNISSIDILSSGTVRTSIAALGSTYFDGGNVGVGDITPAALFTVGNGDLFQVNSSGAIVAVTGITSSGDIIPSTPSTRDLGSSVAEFDELYVADNNGIKLGLDQDAILAYDELTDDRVELSGTGASLFIEDRLSLGAQSYTISNNIVPLSRATGTLTPTASYVKGTCNDPDNCTVTMGESAAKDGDTLVFVNTGSNEFRFTDTAGVTELAGQADLGINDVISMIYNGSAWIEISRSNN